MSLTCTIESGAESEWQEAMTHETQLETDTGNGSVTYDELKGPYLDAAHWSPARLPLPTGGEHNPLDPPELAVGGGEVRVTIPSFSVSHDSSRPPTAPGTSSSRRAASSCQRIAPRRSPSIWAITNVGGEPGDYRRAMVASRCSTWR